MTPGESHNEWYQYYCSNICPFKNSIVWSACIVYIEGLPVIISKIYYISSIEDWFVLANSADPDDLPHYAAFNLSLHYLSSYRLGVSVITGLKHIHEYPSLKRVQS